MHMYVRKDPGAGMHNRANAIFIFMYALIRTKYIIGQKSNYFSLCFIEKICIIQLVFTRVYPFSYFG